VARYKRLRRCLNPKCSYAGGGGKTLWSTWVQEYARLVCPECGQISVFNAIGTVSPDVRRHIYVARDGTKGDAVEHVWPKIRVLVA